MSRKTSSPRHVFNATESAALMRLLEDRFAKYKGRHPELRWDTVRSKLESAPEKLWSLHEMERTGGEPDVIGSPEGANTIVFCDCSAESPAGRRNLCYDRAALDARKTFKPAGCAMEMAANMGIELLSEAAYRALQEFGNFDTKTSSWIATPSSIRQLGGALFCDRRYGAVFVYHNGAESYYAARGFRGSLTI